jgi:DNA-directed RNA polymerase subunit L
MQSVSVRKIKDQPNALICLIPGTHVTLAWAITKSMLQHEYVEMATATDRNVMNANITNVAIPEDDWYHKELRIQVADKSPYTPLQVLQAAARDVLEHITLVQRSSPTAAAT